MLETTAIEEVFEEFLVLFIVRGVLEFQLTAVSHILCEFFRIPMTQGFNRCVDFALLDLSVFVVLVSGTQSLPRKLTLQQV